MKVKFLIGRAGTGKSEYCLNEIADNIGYDKPLVLLVPNQFSLQMEKNLVKKTNGAGMDKAQVLSFERLAYRVFSLYGKPCERIIDDFGKAALLKKILSENKDRLRYYGSAYKKDGFVSGLIVLLTEFCKYGVDEKCLQNLIENKGGGAAVLTAKIHDISIIFSEFYDFLKDRFISAEQSMNLLSRALDDAHYYHKSKIWIDGFHRFTRQDYDVIEKLASICESMTISLTMPESTDLSVSANAYDPFYETISTAGKIIACVNEYAESIEYVRMVKAEVYGYKKPLMHLEREYFNYSGAVYEKENNSVFVTPFGAAFDEARYVASHIVELVRDHGYMYKDIAVCVCDLEAYEQPIRDEMSICGIPFFIDMSKRIYNKRIVELIRALMEAGTTNFSSESVIRLLKTGLLGFSDSETDIFENYILEYNISGWKWHGKDWSAGASKYNLQDINGLRRRFNGFIEPFFSIWQSDTVSVKEAAVSLFEFFTNNGINIKMLEYGDAEDAHKIWNILVNMFDRIVDIMGDEATTLLTFSQIIEGGLETALEGFIPAAQDNVIIGDIKRTRLPDIKVLFIMGLNDNVIPSPKGDGGLLTEADRSFIIENGIELDPHGVRQTIEEQFLIYCAVTKPKERLYISWPQMDFDDNELKKSVVAERIKHIFPSAKPIHTNYKYASEKAFMHEAACRLSGLLSGENDDLSDLAWVAYHRSESFDKLLDKAVAKRDYRLSRNLFDDSNIYSSVTRIEKYISCPFSYFAQYVLNAKERKQSGLLAVDIGSIYHDVIEYVSKMLEQSGYKWGEADDRQTEAFIEEGIEEVCGETELTSEKFILSKIKAVTRRAVRTLNYQAKNGSFVPFGYELEFGGAKSPLKPIIIELSEGYKFIFTGRIDRVDILDKEGKRYIKIIDYKSGSKKFDLREAYFGLQLQLLLYMSAYLEQNGNNLPAGVFYFRIKDPVVNSPKDDSEEGVIDGLLRALKLSGLVVNDADIINALHNGIDGDSNIIPVKLKAAKNGIQGEPDQHSSVATLEQFYGLMKRAEEVIKIAGIKLINGFIEPRPVRLNSFSPCNYCGYSPMCGFDGRYNDLSKISKKDILDQALNTAVNEVRNGYG